MTLIVASPETKKYAYSIAEEVGADLVATSDFRKEHTRDKKIVFIGRNGNNHNRDLDNIHLIKNFTGISGKDLSLNLFDAHTDTLVKNEGVYYEEIERVANYANWAGLGLNAGIYSELNIVGNVNGNGNNCPRGHFGADFIIRAPPEILSKMKIYPSGPRFSTKVRDKKGLLHARRIERALNKNSSVSYAIVFNGELNVIWTPYDEAKPDPRRTPASFSSIDLDVLDRGFVDSDWSPRGNLSIGDLITSIRKFKVEGDNFYSICGLREDSEPRGNDIKNLARLVREI